MGYLFSGSGDAGTDSSCGQQDPRPFNPGVLGKIKGRSSTGRSSLNTVFKLVNQGFSNFSDNDKKNLATLRYLGTFKIPTF